MTSQDKITDRPRFIKFIRNLREVKATQAHTILGVCRATAFNYENGKVIITDKIFNHVIECYSVTDRDIQMYLTCHEGQAIGWIVRDWNKFHIGKAVIQFIKV